MVIFFNKLIKNKKGFMSIYVIIGLAVFLPIMLFVSIDTPYMMTMNRKIKNTLDNASATAITCINETSASSGLIQIEVAEAERMAKKVIQESFGLNEDLTVNSNSLIAINPKITIKVINNPTIEPTYTTLNGVFEIKNPSVIIYAEIPVQAKFMTSAKPIVKYTAISQAQFK